MADPATKQQEVQHPVEAGGEKARPVDKLDRQGAALSDPKEARTVEKTRNTGGTDGLPPGDKLLDQIKGKSDTPAGPKFPLDKAYDPTKDYVVDGRLTERAKELQDEAKKLVSGAAKPDGSLSLPDHGKIMESIAKDKSLSEGDKWYLYKQVCDLEQKGRDSDGRLIPGTKDYRVLFDAAKPTGIVDSLKGDVVRHVIIDPTSDGYHGELVYGKGSLGSLYQTGEDGIWMHEHVGKPLKNLFRSGGWIDHGDEEESKRQLSALRAMQKGGFNAYTEEWNKSFAR